MSQRPGFLVDTHVRADGGKPPNQYRDRISTQIRCHWPPLAPKADVKAAIMETLVKAIEELDRLRPDE